MNTAFERTKEAFTRCSKGLDFVLGADDSYNL